MEALLQKLIERAENEWRDVKEVPYSMVALAVICVGLSVYGTSCFYAERIAIKDERIAQLETSNQQLEKRIGQLERSTNSKAAGNGDALTSWGGGAPRSCGGDLNRNALSEYADKFDVVVACGISYPNTDRFADTAITLSNKFSLTESSPIRLAMPGTAAMTSALDDWMRAEVRKQPPQKQSSVRFNVPVWYEVLLVPKDVLVSDIRRLSDVRRLGGQVVAGQGRAAVVQSISPMPTSK